MKRLKDLRTAHGYTQSQLADILRTTEQTVALWESGAVEPDLKTLRDLAMLFGTSVDEILGSHPFARKPTSNIYCLGREGIEGFWGHVGLLLPGQEHTYWFPITSGARERAHIALANAKEDPNWISVETLDNRLLVFHPERVDRIWLLDDAADEPDDWDDDALSEYTGRPSEFYRGLQAYFDTEDMRASYSKAFIEEIEGYVREKGLDETSGMGLLNHTKVYMTDGSQVHSYWVEPEDLYDFFHRTEVGDVPKLVRLNGFGGEFVSYFPEAKLAALDMPLLEVTDFAKKELQEIEAGLESD